MSIATMVGLEIERQGERDVASGMVAGGRARATKRTVDTAMEKIAAFIPSEVIAIYVAGFGILSPQSNSGKWSMFGVSLVLIPVFVLLNYLQQRKHAGTDQGARLKSLRRTSVIVTLFAIVAFVAWAAALPGTPFLSVTPRATAYGGFCVVILALIMYRLADLLDVVPKKP
jgi:hypothetical protein